MTLAEFISVAGLIFGLSGFILGILNYLRDRAHIEVTLQWDLTVTPGTEYDPAKPWGLITVTNAGRRSAYVSHVALRLPRKKFEDSHLVIMSGIAGKKLSEGDQSERYLVSQDGMEEYARHWRDIVAQVSDSTGKVWKSKKLDRKAIPSWAKA